MRDTRRYVNYRHLVVEYQRMRQGNEFERKHVYRIQCRDCKAVITDRGMSAILLSDHSIQLFSTDLFPDTVGFVHGDYSASSCGCRVRDTACLECGNVIGYHVNVPCKVCLEQNHNGHYWMFRNLHTRASRIFYQVGPKSTEIPLLWGFVKGPDEESCYYRTGDALAAHESCRLSVRTPFSIPLIVRQPQLTRVIAHTADQESYDPYLEMCR